MELALWRPGDAGKRDVLRSIRMLRSWKTTMSLDRDRQVADLAERGPVGCNDCHERPGPAHQRRVTEQRYGMVGRGGFEPSDLTLIKRMLWR
jgi:hypothetical protein